eukprot:1158239-Pelagomonas_calceolata.AAC.8
MSVHNTDKGGQLPPKKQAPGFHCPMVPPGGTCQISRGVIPTFDQQISISDHPLHQIGRFQGKL